MTDDQLQPDQPHPERFAKKPLWRRRLLLITATCCVAGFAAWWCFRQPAVAVVPGTIHTEQFDDRRIWNAFTHPACGRAAFVMNGPIANGTPIYEFRSERWPTIELSAPNRTRSTRPPLGGFQSGAILEDTSGRIAIVGNNGVLAIREPDGVVQRYVITQPTLETSSDEDAPPTYFDLIIRDIAWHDSRLTIIGTNYQAASAWEATKLIYDIPTDDLDKPVLIPQVIEPTNTKSISLKLSPDGNHWAALDFIALNRIVSTQKLTLSNGSTIEVPVATVGQGSAQTSSIYFHIIGDPSADRISLLRMTADHEHIELVEVPLTDSVTDVRPPLQLPTRYINTDVSQVSPDGRYVVLCSGDYSGMRVPWLSSVIPQVGVTNVIHDLVLVDLYEWRVVATERVRFSSLGKDLPTAWYRPEISHDSKHVLVPQGDRYSVVDIEQWANEAASK